MIFNPLRWLIVNQIPRHHRQMLLPEWGQNGQERIARGHVAIVGMGALGCGIADVLARAGVGTLTIVDRDVVEITNLQRQTLYTSEDAAIGLPKVQAAERRLLAIDPSLSVRSHAVDLTHLNVNEVIEKSVQVVLDGTDNFATRYLLNDVCVERGVPLCYGGVIATRGMQATLTPGEDAATGACLRCLFEEPPAAGTTPTCDTAGVLGSVVSIVAATQATDALKLLLGRQDLLSRTLLEFDLWANQRRRVDIRGTKRSDCPCCGVHGIREFLTGRGGEEPPHLCGQNAVQISGNRKGIRVDLESLSERLASHGRVTGSKVFVRLECASAMSGWNEAAVITVFADGRAIVKGTEDAAQARSLYAKLIGM